MTDTQNDEKTEDQPKHRGRPKNENFLSYEEAREFIRNELLPSRGKYFEWWNLNKPKSIPRFPYRVYQKEWTSWNDFLGTNNQFNNRLGQKWRPLDEATMYIHTLKLSSQEEWMKYCRANKLPDGIPTRPDLVYDKWRSWSHWLGNKPIAALEAQQAAQKIQVYYIIHEQGVPSNVFTFGVEPMGISALKERWEYEQFDVIRLFWYDKMRSMVIKQIVEQTSSPMFDDVKQRIVPNIWETIWHLQSQMELIQSV